MRNRLVGFLIFSLLLISSFSFADVGQKEKEKKQNGYEQVAQEIVVVLLSYDFAFTPQIEKSTDFEIDSPIEFYDEDNPSFTQDISSNLNKTIFGSIVKAPPILRKCFEQPYRFY